MILFSTPSIRVVIWLCCAATAAQAAKIEDSLKVVSETHRSG